MDVLLLLIFIIVAHVTSDPFQGYSYRFTSTNCSGSSMNTTSNHFCFVKAYSKSVSTMNFGLTLIRDLNQLFLKYSIDFKYGAVFRPIMDPPVLEWCSFMSGNSNNVLLNMIIDMIKDSVPGLIHSCPYQVIMSIYLKKLF